MAFLISQASLRGQGNQQRTNKPNILFLFADDWGYYASCFADEERPGVNDVIYTPAIDQLALEGVSFNHAYVNVPSCTPSRASVATGCYFWRCGKSANLRGGEWEGVDDPGNQLVGFGTLLQEHGYHTGRTYKTLDSRWFPGKVYQDAGTDFCRYSQTLEAATSIEEGHAVLKQELLDNFHAFLADRDQGQSFCYVWGPHNPHRPWIQGSGKRIWGIEPDDLKGKMPGHLPDTHEVREDFADYLGEVQAFDRGVQILVEELRHMGELENTLIVLSGDNGIPGFTRGKCNLYDFGVRTPLVLRWGGIKHTNRKLDDFVNLVDLAPTLLELADITPPEEMDGKSLVPLLKSRKSGLVDSARDHVIVGRERHMPQGREGNLPYPSRAIHTKDFIYIRNFKPDRSPMGSTADLDPDRVSSAYESLKEYTNTRKTEFKDLDNSPTKAVIVTRRKDPDYAGYFELGFGLRPLEELYDLRSDPDQLTNVAGFSEYEKIRKELEDRLLSTLRETHDPRIDDLFDYMPYVENPAHIITP